MGFIVCILGSKVGLKGCGLGFNAELRGFV